MRGTNILVRSLPADPVGDQRVREAVEGKGGEKGGAYEPCNLYTHLFVCVCVKKRSHSYRLCQTGKSDGGLKIRGAREFALKVTGFTPHPLGEKKKYLTGGAVGW